METKQLRSLNEGVKKVMMKENIKLGSAQVEYPRLKEFLGGSDWHDKEVYTNPTHLHHLSRDEKKWAENELKKHDNYSGVKSGGNHKGPGQLAYDAGYHAHDYTNTQPNNLGWKKALEHLGAHPRLASIIEKHSQLYNGPWDSK